MSTLYFSNCSLVIPVKGGSEVISPGRKVPSAFIESLEQKELDSLLANRDIVAKDPLEVPKPKAEVASERVPTAEWRFDVAELVDKPLNVLNMMIQDHVQKHGLAPVEAFTTLDEAVHWMSQDIRKG